MTDTPEPSHGPARGTRRSNARDGVVADLDVRLRRTQTRLDEVTATVTDSADLLAQALPRIDGALDGLAELRGRLDGSSGPAAAGGDEGPPANAPVHWPSLTVDEAAHAWDQLGQWIAETFVPWYEISREELPDCWPLHRPAVLELSWLRTCYVEAFTSDARPQLAAEWNTRWLRDVLAAIGRHIDHWKCRPGAHTTRDGNDNDPDFTPPPERPDQARVGHDGERHPSYGDKTELAYVQNWRANFNTAAARDLARRRQAQNPPATG